MKTHCTASSTRKLTPATESYFHSLLLLHLWLMTHDDLWMILFLTRWAPITCILDLKCIDSKNPINGPLQMGSNWFFCFTPISGILITCIQKPGGWLGSILGTHWFSDVSIHTEVEADPFANRLRVTRRPGDESSNDGVPRDSESAPLGSQAYHEQLRCLTGEILGNPMMDPATEKM